MRRFTPALFAAALATLLTMSSLPAHAQQRSIVVPSGLANTEGSGNNSYPFNLLPLNVKSLRLQQVYSASEFGTRRLLITDLEFRPDAAQGLDFLGFIDDVQINLSTTSAAVDGLSATFAANVGADNIIVYPRHNLTLSSNFNGPALGPKNFDISIRLNTPFVYDPAAGNLLLDVQTFACTVDTTIFDAVRASGDTVSRIYALDVAAGTGTRDTLGLVTRFKAMRISSLSGRVELEDASNLGIPLTFEFRRSDDNTRFTRIVLPNAAGNFNINNLPSAVYELGIKGSKWLRKTTTVDLTSGDVTNFNYVGPNALRGGDANDDNAVDISDLLLLINHYNQRKNVPLNNPGYLDAADFDNDNTNDISDLLIMIHNYNKLGDP